MEFGLVLMGSGPRGACLLGGALRGSVVGGAERAGLRAHHEAGEGACTSVERLERAAVARRIGDRLRLEKISALDGAGEGPSMASDTPRGAALVRLLEQLEPFELGQAAKS
jgi:hypothetical protein